MANDTRAAAYALRVSIFKARNRSNVTHPIAEAATLSYYGRGMKIRMLGYRTVKRKFYCRNFIGMYAPFALYFVSFENAE
jgi:hypothetical protein